MSHVVVALVLQKDIVVLVGVLLVLVVLQLVTVLAVVLLQLQLVHSVAVAAAVALVQLVVPPQVLVRLTSKVKVSVHQQWHLANFQNRSEVEVRHNPTVHLIHYSKSSLHLSRASMVVVGTDSSLKPSRRATIKGALLQVEVVLIPPAVALLVVTLRDQTIAMKNVEEVLWVLVDPPTQIHRGIVVLVVDQDQRFKGTLIPATAPQEAKAMVHHRLHKVVSGEESNSVISIDESILLLYRCGLFLFLKCFALLHFPMQVFMCPVKYIDLSFHVVLNCDTITCIVMLQDL